mgnify:CR=1 FL=1
MRENEVEKQFVEAVRASGGQALKFTSQSMNGVPDRLVLLLGGKCAFVEMKAPGKQMRILQRKRRLQLEALGFPVFCVDRPEQIQPAIHALLHWKPGEPIPQGIGAKIPVDAGSYAAAEYARTGRKVGKRGDAQMKFIPHDYQSYCTEYIKTHPVAALFLDMGLG